MLSFHNEELVEAGGYRLTLALDFSAIDYAEHLTGQTMPEIVGTLGSHPPVGLTSKLLLAMLRRHHPELRLDGVAGLLMGKQREVFGRAILDLLMRTMNYEEAKPDAKPSEKVQWSIRTFLTEWLSLGGSDDRFWAQTPRSYVACMEGMAKAATRQVDLGISVAWHTAAFSNAAMAGKLKSLAEYRGEPPAAQSNEDMFKMLQTFSEMGAPMTFEQIN